MRFFLFTIFLICLKEWSCSGYCRPDRTTMKFHVVFLALAVCMYVCPIFCTVLDSFVTCAGSASWHKWPLSHDTVCAASCCSEVPTRLSPNATLMKQHHRTRAIPHSPCPCVWLLTSMFSLKPWLWNTNKRMTIEPAFRICRWPFCSLVCCSCLLFSSCLLFVCFSDYCLHTAFVNASNSDQLATPLEQARFVSIFWLNFCAGQSSCAWEFVLGSLLHSQKPMHASTAMRHVVRASWRYPAFTACASLLSKMWEYQAWLSLRLAFDRCVPSLTEPFERKVDLICCFDCLIRRHPLDSLFLTNEPDFCLNKPFLRSNFEFAKNLWMNSDSNHMKANACT